MWVWTSFFIKISWKKWIKKSKKLRKNQLWNSFKEKIKKELPLFWILLFLLHIPMKNLLKNLLFLPKINLFYTQNQVNNNNKMMKISKICLLRHFLKRINQRLIFKRKKNKKKIKKKKQKKKGKLNRKKQKTKILQLKN